MTDKKLSSDEVPGKFTEWLLDMGCPAEKVPSVENMTAICRGHYYMVWRNLMEQVDAKDVIRSKRMQVFCDDVRKCQKKNVFHEGNANTVVPEQLLVWNQQAEIRKKVEEAKTRVTLVRQDLELLNQKICNKMSQRDLARIASADVSRRAWLLKEVAAELQTKTDNLRETRDIADSLCASDDDDDLQNKLDKCIASIRRQNSQPTDKQGLSSSTASVTSSSGDNDFESLIDLARRSGGTALCREVLSRRAALLTALTSHSQTVTRHRISPQSVLAHTAALHCSLALEATKNKLHAKQTSKKLLATIADLNNYLSGEACELLVLRCERADAEARVGALRALLGDLTAGAGPFRVAPESGAPAPRQTVAALDKAIESKRSELLRVISSVRGTERRAAAASARLAAALTLLQTHLRTHTHPYTHTHGNQLDMSELSPETIAEMKEFYENRRERRKQKLDISLDIDASDSSALDTIDYNNPKFVDELRIYLNKFSLEKNRQLVLESGEKLWLFETVAASHARLISQWIQGEAPLLPLPPPRSPCALLASLVRKVKHEQKLQATLEALGEGDIIKDIDISSQVEEESVITDRVKKRLSENLLELHKVNKSLSLAEDNLKLWSDNKTRKYIAASRTVEGQTYIEYERCYIEDCLNL